MTSAKPGKKTKGDKGEKLKKKHAAPPPPAGKPGAKPGPAAAVAEKPAKPKGPDAAAMAATAKAAAKQAAGGAPGKPARKERKGRRRELDFPEGELVLPGGPQTPEEVLYVLRGAVCAERPAGEHAVEEILTKRGALENQPARAELLKLLEPVKKRFDTVIEPMLPSRSAGIRRTFQSVMERARYRRREMGAFMRGLDLGRTEMGHMDPHGEDSLHELMKWAARLENLLESEEPEKADYAQFHRGLDQLENTTEALIIDVEQTLRRLRDRNRAQ